MDRVITHEFTTLFQFFDNLSHDFLGRKQRLDICGQFCRERYASSIGIYGIGGGEHTQQFEVQEGMQSKGLSLDEVVVIAAKNISPLINTAEQCVEVGYIIVHMFPDSIDDGNGVVFTIGVIMLVCIAGP